MKILHSVLTMGENSGGTTHAVSSLVRGLNQAGCSADVLSLDTSSRGEKVIGKQEQGFYGVPYDARTPWCYSKNIRCFLKSHDEYDIYHANAIWSDVPHATAHYARRHRKPYIISLHGGIGANALLHNPWRKRIMLRLVLNKDLHMAACVHATSKQEADAYRALGFTNNVALIGNPVPIPDYLDTLPRQQSRFRLGYLGRIHPLKKIDHLIRAWASAGHAVREGELCIIGGGDEAYTAMLHELVKQLGLANVRFTGFLSGKRKFEELAALSVLCLPSDSENFGLVVAEALLAGTPVIASRHTPWQSLETERCGYWTDNTVDGLSHAISACADKNAEELSAMGRRGRTFIEREYHSSIIADRMITLYQYITGKGPKPDFVI